MESGFYSRYFCCAKKKWWFTSDFGLASFEPCAQSEQVQDADSKVHFVSDPTRRLVCDHRSKGCIFSHPDRQETQEASQVRFREQSLPVLCSSVRPCSGSSNVYKMYGRSPGPIVAPGHPNCKLSGWLSNISSIPGSGTDTSRLSAPSPKEPRATDKSTKECSATTSAYNLSGGSYGFSHDAGMSVSHTCAVIRDMSESVQNGTSSPCWLVSQTVGSDGGSIPCSSAGPAPHATISVVDQEPEHFTSLSSASQNYGDMQRLSCSKAMEEIPVPSGRSPARDRFSLQNYHDGRIPDGLGGGPFRTSSPWNLDRRTSELAHKSFGTIGSLPGSQTVLTTVERLALETEPGGRGMEITPPGGESHMAEVQPSGSGSVRFKHDYALPALVFPVSSIASRSGCSGPQLSQNQCVCFSPYLAAPSCSAQSTIRQSGAPAVSYPVVAHPVMVLDPGQFVDRPSLGGSPQTRSVDTSSGHDLASSAGIMEVMGVAPEKNALMCSGLSAEATDTIIKGIVHFEIKIWYLSAYPKGIQDVGVFFSSVDPILMFLGQTVLVCQSYNGRYRSLSL